MIIYIFVTEDLVFIVIRNILFWEIFLFFYVFMVFMLLLKVYRNMLFFKNVIVLMCICENLEFTGFDEILSRIV